MSDVISVNHNCISWMISMMDCGVMSNVNVLFSFDNMYYARRKCCIFYIMNEVECI